VVLAGHRQEQTFLFYSYEGRRDKSQIQLCARCAGEYGTGDHARKSAGLPDADNLSASRTVNLHPSTVKQRFFGSGSKSGSAGGFANAAQKYPANDFTVGDSSPNELLNTAGSGSVTQLLPSSIRVWRIRRQHHEQADLVRSTQLHSGPHQWRRRRATIPGYAFADIVVAS